MMHGRYSLRRRKKIFGALYSSRKYLVEEALKTRLDPFRPLFLRLVFRIEFGPPRHHRHTACRREIAGCIQPTTKEVGGEKLEYP